MSSDLGAESDDRPVERPRWRLGLRQSGEPRLEFDEGGGEQRAGLAAG
jgi:hypothetical protein